MQLVMRNALCAEDAAAGTGDGKQSCRQTASHARLCIFQLNAATAANTNILLSQVCYCHESSINVTCARFMRFDFGTCMLSSSCTGKRTRHIVDNANTDCQDYF